MDKEQRDFAEELIEKQAKYNAYVPLLIEAKKILSCEKNILAQQEARVENAKNKFEEIVTEMDAMHKDIITTKQLLNATMR